MLGEIRQLLTERSRMSLRELSIHFRIDPEALESMMELLVRKGHVRLIDANCRPDRPRCAGCACAHREDLIVYAAISSGT